MKLETSRFGELEYSEHDIITFEHGIPGFKEERRFLLLSDDKSPFLYLQSIENGKLAFIVVSPFDFFEEYEFTLPQHVQDELGLDNESQVRIVNIVKISGGLETASINLVAPIVINKSAGKGMQYIMPESRYSIQQPLFGALLDAGGVR